MSNQENIIENLSENISGNISLNGVNITDTNIDKFVPLPALSKLKEKYALSSNARKLVSSTRESIKKILDGEDDRKIILVGPCSIHDIELAKELTHKINDLSNLVSDKFLVIGRYYFEKPRSGEGWRGLISDPHLNGSRDMVTGLSQVLDIVSYANDRQVPVATEFLNTLSPTYYTDYVSWAAIGARNSGAQIYREFASGLSMPVGFKNCDSGDISKAIDSIVVSKKPAAFFGVDPNGSPALVYTKGNKYAHLVLRGGTNKPNYDAESVKLAQELLIKKDQPPKILIDCSHDNSRKNHENQPKVLLDCIDQIVAGNSGIIGFMLESNLYGGKQSIPSNLDGFDRSTLKYGVSVTDNCLSWEDTVIVVTEAYGRLKN